MRWNLLFKTYGVQDYLDAAEESAAWIRKHERTTPYGKRWVQCPDSDEDFSDYPMLTEKALYGGSAGVGLFFLRMYQMTGREKYLQDAEAAAADIMATYEGRDFYTGILENMKGTEDKLAHVKNMPGWEISYGNGPAGGAYLVLKLYEQTRKEAYKAYYLRVSDDLLAVSRRVPEGLYWSEQNDLTGDGGFALTLISAWKISGDRKYLEAAADLGRYIESKGKPAPGGGRYWNVVDLGIVDFPKDVFWVNFAHGTSGVGWIFAILYDAVKDERFLQAARDAAEYIEGIATGNDDAVLVPYLDSIERGPSTEFYYLSTCHGPAGTSKLFEALYKITGEEEYLSWVRKLSRGIIEAGAPERYSRGYWPSQCICCGTPGLLEHFVAVYKLTGEEEFLGYARRTAAMMMGQSYVDDGKDIYRTGKTRRWYGNWWRTIPTEVHSYTGLYIGTSGNAWSFLTLAAAETGKSLVGLLEQNYL